MGDAALRAAVGRDVRTVDEVLAAMAAVDGAVGAGDGLGWFNRLYRRTTDNVRAGLAAGRFVDVAFTSELDVVFAGYYFRAVSAFLSGASDVPRAWVVLLERRARRDVAPLQFALAGMNAHIDRDLSFAIVDVAAARGGFPARDSDARADYLTVNAILAETEQETKPWFEGALLRDAEPDAGRVEDVVALFSVQEAREAAWLRAEVQWATRGVPAAAAALAAGIDRAAAALGRALLLPTRLA